MSISATGQGAGSGAVTHVGGRGRGETRAVNRQGPEEQKGLPEELS